MKLVRLLTDFGKATRRGVDYADFTIDQYHALKILLTTRDYSLNYVGALLKDLKLLLKQSHSEGLHNSTGYQHKEFRKFSEEVDNVYLTDTELQQVNDLDLTKQPRLDRVRAGWPVPSVSDWSLYRIAVFGFLGTTARKHHA